MEIITLANPPIENILTSETSKYFFANPSLDLLSDPPERTFAVDIYPKNGSSTCDPYSKEACNTRNYWIADQPILVNAATEDANVIKVYPNPNAGEFTLRIAGNWAGEYNYKLTDQMGRELLKVSISKSTLLSDELLNIHALNNGIYFLTIINENGDKKVQKIIKTD